MLKQLTATTAVIGLFVSSALFLSACSPNIEAPVYSEKTVVQTKSPKSILSNNAQSVIAQFDSQRAEVLKKILDKFFQDGFTIDSYHMYEGRTIEEASPDMSAQAVLDRHVVKESFLSRMPNLGEALNHVEIVARPGTEAFGDVTSALTNAANDSLVISDEEIVIKSTKFDNGTLFSPNGSEVIVSAQDVPTLVISGMSQNKRTVAVRVFQYDFGVDGQKGEWREVYGARAEDFPYDFNSIDSLPIAKTG